MSFSACRHCGTNHHGAHDRGRCRDSCQDLIDANESEIAADEDTLRALQASIQARREQVAALRAIASGTYQQCLVCKGRTEYRHEKHGILPCDSCGRKGYLIVEPWKPSGLNNWNNGPRDNRPSRWAGL